MTTQDHQAVDSGCGQRLRKAREAANLSLQDVAVRLRMPVRVVESLEAEDWSRLGAPVFVRGQIRSYSRLLGLATAPIQAAVGVGAVQPTRLEPRTYTAPMQRLAEQLARKAVYIVITAALVIPVWVATRTHLVVPSQESPSLDLPAGRDAKASGTLARRAPPSPVAASMAPVVQRAVQEPALSLRVAGDSWVQVMAPDGSTLEEGVLGRGEQREFGSGEVGRVVIGNAEVAELRLRGIVQDLSSFQRANVARFTVSSDGSLRPVAE
ncbi:MAG: helix-turn-helix domain-containing protein [Luteimonas sp.]